MKCLASIGCLLTCVSIQAQTGTAPIRNQLQEASAYMNGAKGYNPQKAFNLYSQCAEKGNAQAMNALGVHYSKGLGVQPDATKAFDWFVKASKGGYVNAWANLGEMYQKGYGTSVDFKQAYNCYQKAAASGSQVSEYKLGYLLYKGLGTAQSYEKAFQFFHAASLKGYGPGMYFLGLCYRNGYGVVRNIDSARYWLQKAALKGSDQAREELSIKDPENPLQPIEVPAQALSSTIKALHDAADGLSKYKRIKHNLTATDLSGTYSGYAIKYDWSGTHITGVSKLIVKIEQAGSGFTGTWIEDDSVAAEFNSALTESSLEFNNTQYGRIHHYSGNKPEIFEFKAAAFQLVKNADSIYLSGNLQLYSPSRQEPGKPYYAVLTKQTTAEKSAVTISRLQTYPNPFTSEVAITFNIQKSSHVNMAVYTIDGKRVYNDVPETLLPGEYKRTISLNGPAGMYIVQLECNGEIKTAKITKQ